MTLAFHLTQLRFQPQRKDSIQVLGDPYRLHQFVYELFGGVFSSNRILYRLESDVRDAIEHPVVIVQSLREPANGITPSFVSVRSKDVHLEIEPRTYRFKARVNPVRTIPSREQDRRGKRVGVYHDDDQIEWFRGRLRKNGIELREFRHQRETWQQIHKRGRSSDETLTLASALFEGLIVIRDSKLAANVILNGIGPGKGFGFGLLSLAGP